MRVRVKASFKFGSPMWTQAKKMTPAAFSIVYLILLHFVSTLVSLTVKQMFPSQIIYIGITNFSPVFALVNFKLW